MVCQFYLSFKKTQLLVLLIFAMISFVSFAFISALSYCLNMLNISQWFLLLSDIMFWFTCLVLACFPPQECEPMVGVILSVCSSIMSGPEMVPGRY